MRTMAAPQWEPSRSELPDLTSQFGKGIGAANSLAHIAARAVHLSRWFSIEMRDSRMRARSTERFTLTRLALIAA